MTHFTTKDAATALAKKGTEFITMLQHGSLKVEWYKPENWDKQMPHRQDEIYVIASGNGTFYHTGERISFSAGDLLFVPAGDEHRFENFTEDFATWVIFYGQDGGE